MTATKPEQGGGNGGMGSRKERVGMKEKGSAAAVLCLKNVMLEGTWLKLNTGIATLYARGGKITR